MFRRLCKCLFYVEHWQTVTNANMICKRKRKRLHSFALVVNLTFWIFLISLAITCCFNAQVFYSSHDLDFREDFDIKYDDNFNQNHISGRNSSSNATEIVAPPWEEDEIKYQRDILDSNIDAHFAQVHGDAMHRVRRPLLQDAQPHNTSQYALPHPPAARRTDSHTPHSIAVHHESSNPGKLVQPKTFLDNTILQSDKGDNKDSDVRHIKRNPPRSDHESGMGVTAERGTDTRPGEEKPRRRLPSAIIIGVKKAGTRALLEYLRMHPLVQAPGPEPHFFDKNYNRGLDWYRNQMPVSREGDLTMEKTPSYFITKEAPRRIHNMSTDVKLLVVVRNPVTRAISDYVQARQRRPDLPSFEHMAFVDGGTERVNSSWGGIRIGLYVRSLQHWLRYFPQSQIRFVDGERLITHPGEEMRKVQDFLQLPIVINESHFAFNSTKGFPCLLKPKDKGKPHCLGSTKGRAHPNVSRKAIHTLQRFFRPYNQRLFSHIGQTFDWYT